MAENQSVEYKESWRDEYLKWVAGFANAQGGTLLIGVNDKGEVVGLDNARRLLEDLPNKIQNALGIVSDVNLLEQDGQVYIEIVTLPMKCRSPITANTTFVVVAPKRYLRVMPFSSSCSNGSAKPLMMWLSQKRLLTI